MIMNLNDTVFKEDTKQLSIITNPSYPLTKEMTNEEVFFTKKDTSPCSHSADSFHAWMLMFAVYAGPLDIPTLKRVDAVPNRLIAFSDAMKPNWTDYDCWVHFFEDDSILERFWNNPLKYITKLRRFRGVIGLDYSVGWNFPRALKEYNHFRNSVCTYWFQTLGLKAIPQARCEASDYKNVLAGFPKNSVIAIGARSMVRKLEDRTVLVESVKLIVDFLKPSHIVWYGSTQYGVTNYLSEMNIPYTVFEGKGRGRLVHGIISEVGCK